MKMKSGVVLAALLVPVSFQFAAAGELETAALSGAGALEQAAASVKALLAGPETDPAQARQKMLDEKLLDAASTVDVAEIRRLVAMGANPNAYDGYHFTPLTQAVASGGDPDVLNALLDLGAQVDEKGTCDNTALHMAAEDGRLEAAQILVAHHATVDAKACLGDTPLVVAAANGKADVFNYLLGLGADPNAKDYQGKTPLILAVNLFVAPKDNGILTSLLADPRVNPNAEDQDGMTALKTAVKNDGVDAVKLLLALPGVDVNDNGGGTTALFLADLNKYNDIADLLRAAGAKELAGPRSVASK